MCGEPIERDIRIKLRFKEMHFQQDLSEWTPESVIRIGDVTVPTTRFVDDTDTVAEIEEDDALVEITRTLYDSEWFCPGCWDRLEATVPEEQVTLNEL